MSRGRRVRKIAEDIGIVLLWGSVFGFMLWSLCVYGGCVANTDVATTADLDASVKAIGDDVRQATEQIISAQATAGRDLLQHLESTSETTTTTGLPWYGVASLAAGAGAGFLLLAWLMSRWGYRPANWRRKRETEACGR